MNKRLYALGRLKSGEMNKTEAAYNKRLESMRAAGEIAAYWFEGITLKLADGCRYTPDFLVLLPGGELELHEVKGARAVFRDDAKAKAKVCAEKYPFLLVVAFPARGGAWELEEF